MKESMKESMNLYRVTTTFLGAGESSCFYFDTEEKAREYLSKLENGEVEKVKVTSNELNYSDGCNFNDLIYGEFWAATEEEI